MRNETHSEFCKELGNSNYAPNNRTIENQNEFFQRKLGVSREEVVNIEEDKFHKILEGKSGKKIGYDPNIKIDRCTPVMLNDKEER